MAKYKLIGGNIIANSSTADTSYGVEIRGGSINMTAGTINAGEGIKSNKSETVMHVLGGTIQGKAIRFIHI